MPSDYYRARSTFWDFKRRPAAVSAALKALRDAGAGKRAWGLGNFGAYVRAFTKNAPTLTGYYGARGRLGARQWSKDKYRALLQSILTALAPNPEVGSVCVGEEGGGVGTWWALR